MKRTALNMLAVVIVVILGFFVEIYAWNGEQTWGPITRATIESTANAMINYRWTPKNAIQNWQCAECMPVYWPFNTGTYYNGVAYTQNNPQQSLSDFTNSVTTTLGGTRAYGNDCSGFVSMAWKLTKRYTTTNFEDDAINAPTAPGDYVTSRGAKLVGSAPNIVLLSGDALVKSGDHMVLFKERIATGIKTMEQTADPNGTTPGAKSKEWKWSALQSYRPIRRNSMDEFVFKGSLAGNGSIAYHPNNTYYYSASGTHFGWLGGPNDSTNSLIGKPLV